MASYQYDDALKNRMTLLKINPAAVPTADYWQALRARLVAQNAELAKVTDRAGSTGVTSVILACCSATLAISSGSFGPGSTACMSVAAILFCWYLMQCTASRYHDLSGFHIHDFEPLTQHDYVEVLQLTSNNKVALDYVQNVLSQKRELIFAELVGLRHLKHDADVLHKKFVGELARTLLTSDSQVNTATVAGQIEAVNFYRDNPIYAYVDMKNRKATGQASGTPT